MACEQQSSMRTLLMIQNSSKQFLTDTMIMSTYLPNSYNGTKVTSPGSTISLINRPFVSGSGSSISTKDTKLVVLLWALMTSVLLMLVDLLVPRGS